MSLDAAIARFSKDPWQWAHNLDRAGLDVTLIGQCIADGLAVWHEVGVWSWTDDAGQTHGGPIKMTKLTQQGQATCKRLRESP
jgi:hypothetical protein